MPDVTQLHDDELIKLAGIHSSELSDGYLMHLHNKLNPPPVEESKPEPPPPPAPIEPPVVNVSVESDPTIAQTMAELRDLIAESMSQHGTCAIDVLRDDKGDISRFIITEQ